MFPSQMVHLKIISHSNRPLYPCFPHKWYALKLFPSQIGYFIHVSLANGTPQNCSHSNQPLFHVSLVNGTPQNYFPLKSATLSMFPWQMVCFKIVSHSNRPLYPCFPRKRYTLKLFPTQIGHFIHISLANSTL